MLIRFFAHSVGKGDNAAEYLTKHDGRTNSPPEILEGDLARTVSLINSIDRKHTHTSGVISFAPGDNPSREELFEVINDFKAHFFAGLEPDQFDITFVRHSHLDREEIHFLTPRMELLSGKALNIAPPTETHAFKEKFVQAWNLEKGWADPGDPARQRELSQTRIEEGHKHGYKLRPIREEVHAFLTEQITIEKVSDRKSMIEALASVGLKINREGKDYISIKTEDDKPIRLKGRIYKQDWTYDAELDRANPAEDGRGPGRSAAYNSICARAAWAQCFEYRGKREAFNRAKYPRDAATFEHSTKVDLTHDSLLSDDPDHLFSLSLQPELVPRPTNRRATKRADNTESTVRRDHPDRGFFNPADTAGQFSRVAGTNDTQMPERSAVHSNQQVNHDRIDGTRKRAFEYVEATARELQRSRDTAQISTDTNRSATTGIGRIVSLCVTACNAAIRIVADKIENWLTSENPVKKRAVAPATSNDPEPTPGF